MRNKFEIRKEMNENGEYMYYLRLDLVPASNVTMIMVLLHADDEDGEDEEQVIQKCVFCWRVNLRTETDRFGRNFSEVKCAWSVSTTKHKTRQSLYQSVDCKVLGMADLDSNPALSFF